MRFNKWKEAKLSDISTITMGQSPKGEFCNNKGMGEPLLNGPTEFGSHHPSPTQFTTDIKKSARKGDILFCVRGSTAGRMNWADREYAIGRGIASISPKNENISYFIKGMIDIKLPELLKSATGSTFPNISRVMLTDMNINIPIHEEMVKINNILKSLDDKIETNNKINQKLEEMTQAIFKQWFIDFDFPNEEGKLYKSSGGEMVESEIGMIPVSFKEVKLTDVVEIKYGKNLPKNKLEESGYPVFGGNGIIGYYKEYMYEQKQVLVSCRGAASGKVLASDKMSYITNNSLILEIIKDVTFEYLKQYCKNYSFYSYATGSAQPQITINNISNVRLYIPSDDIMNKFSNILKSLDNQVDKNRKENEKLAKLRDILLPKLMSGEIRVPINN